MTETVAVVTGAARGIGSAIALALAKEGANIVAADVCADLRPMDYPLGKSNELDSLVEELKSIGSQALGVRVDVTKSQEVQEMVRRTLREFKKIDILVNNAGVMRPAPFVDITEEEWDVQIGVNLKGVFLCCKHVVPYMIEQKRGKIINIASIVGQVVEAARNKAAYSVSKAGVIMLTRVLAKELGKYNINVNAICPGNIPTPMNMYFLRKSYPNLSHQEAYEKIVKEQHDMQRGIKVEDVANAVVWLASEDSRNVTGQALAVDAGWHPSAR